MLLGNKADDERVPYIIAEAVAVSFLGFFSGPFFATVSDFDSSSVPSSAIIYFFCRAGNQRRVQNLFRRDSLFCHR